MRRPEVIVEVLAEGGSIVLEGFRTDEGWQFSQRALDGTPDLLNEPSVEYQSAVADSWADALTLMDRYPWHRLHPRWVHPEFRAMVLSAISERHAKERSADSAAVARWHRVCSEQ
jgi:hypothetical protein